MRYCFALVLVLFITAANAHRPSDSFIDLEVGAASTQLRWDIALQDLVLAVDLDLNRDGQLQWGELRQQQGLVEGLASQSLLLYAQGVLCAPRYAPLMLNNRQGEQYLHLQADYSCEVQSLQYGLLSGLDSSHRGVLVATFPNAMVWQDSVQLRALEPGAEPVSVGAQQQAAWQTFADYVIEGIHHIWIGWDHILFLLCLLIPCVLRYGGQGWEPVSAFRPALWQVIGTVSAFTIAHSLTLTAAVLQWLSLPIVWVETIIAASVVFAAANNVGAWVRRGIWRLAFVFGLIHGFGFAAVLAELGLPQNLRLLSLLAFNVGVELGQLVIVLAVMPLFYLMRKSWVYQTGVRLGGSLVVALLASWWLWQRWPA